LGNVKDEMCQQMVQHASSIPRPKEVYKSRWYFMFFRNFHIRILHTNMATPISTPVQCQVWSWSRGPILHARSPAVCL